MSTSRLPSEAAKTTEADALSKVMVIRPTEWQGLRAVAGLAHDMRSPLATIATSAELFEGQLSHAESAYFLNVIRRQAFRLQQMVQDLAEYLDVPTGLHLHPEDVDLGELMVGVCRDFQSLRMTHRLRMELPAVAALAHVDGEKIRRVIQNLLNNAFQYSPGGTSVLARLSVPTVNHGFAVIAVEDEGPGIPVDARREVFEPFLRLEGSRGAGHGLGLYVVEQLVKAHGGEAWVETAASGGARFCCSIPLLPQSE
jgi:two-component system clock-associated histidine kinase SasA